jgi:putative heme-binding domain-containing protein
MAFERGRCAGCHTVGGFGTARGPDLTAVGLRRGSQYLREAILNPAAALPRGQTAMPRDFVDYLMVRVVAEDGTEVRGTRVNEDTYTIQIKDARGVVHSFYKPALRELDKQFDRSLMRGYRDTFTDEEVDDLVSYLMTLTGPAPRLIS